MKVFVSTIVMGLCTLLSVSIAEGQVQEVSKHRGFWLGVGVGGGWNLSSNINGDTRGGGGIFVRMGGTPSERWLIGGEILGFGTSEGGVDFGRGNVTATVMHYLDVDRGVFLKAGVGGAGFTTMTSSTVGNTTTTVTTNDSGFGLTAGVGWDVRLGRNFYLTPGVDFMYQRVSVDGAGGLNNTVVLLTVGAVWH